MKVEIVRAEQKHVKEIVGILNDISALEVERVGMDAPEVIVKAINRSTWCCVGKIDGKIVCMIGIEPSTLLSDTAYLWLITTKEVEDHTFTFVRWSQKFVKELSKHYSTIHGFVDRRNARSLRWLRWLGFSVSATVTESHWRHFELRRA